MGCLCKTIAYGYAYVCTPHLVQLKWTRSYIIAWELKVRWETVTNAYINMESFLKFLSLTRNLIVSSNPKCSEITLCFP